MSSTEKSETSIPITSTHPLQPFKLLELPPALLTLLESSTPPTLTLKPCPNTSHALLSTPTATYRIQQKSSSNPLMILKPTESGDGGVGGVGGNGGNGGVTTIAKIGDTLELLPWEEEVSVKRNKWHAKFAASRKK